jgi:hypothetical protein
MYPLRDHSGSPARVQPDEFGGAVGGEQRAPDAARRGPAADPDAVERTGGETEQSPQHTHARLENSEVPPLPAEKGLSLALARVTKEHAQSVILRSNPKSSGLRCPASLRRCHLPHMPVA